MKIKTKEINYVELDTEEATNTATNLRPDTSTQKPHGWLRGEM